MNVDYSSYKMTNYKWYYEYRNKLGKENLDKFLNMVYGWLIDLKPGQSLDIVNHPKITDRNRELFIKICELFIQEGNIHYEFNKEYTTIKNNNHVSRTRKTEKNKTVEKVGRRISV